MLDEYWFGDTARISPEAPVPVVRAGSAEQRPGGAANVALNVAALGAHTVLAAVIGRDDRGERLTRLSSNAVYGASSCARQPCPRSTSCACLPEASNCCESMPSSRCNRAPRSSAEVFAKLVRAGDAVDPVGLCERHAQPRRRAHRSRTRADIPVLIDPKGTDFKRYRGAYALTPNRGEFEPVVGRAPTRPISAQRRKRCAASSSSSFCS